MKMENIFESIDNFDYKNKIVPESINEDEDGVLGKIADRAGSFIPRAMRFKKAKKIMKKYLVSYTKKAKNLIDKFAKGFDVKISTIESEYKKLVNQKIKPLLEEGKTKAAIELANAQKKELEEYKKEQINVLEKGISNILKTYSDSIERRIDSPGFVLNVELSDKGKGELKAKWEELSAIQTIEVDKYKTKLIKSSGWKKLEKIINSLDNIIEEYKLQSKLTDIDFHVQSITKLDESTFRVKVHLRISGGRINLKEKGLIIGNDPNNLEYSKGSEIISVSGEYAYNASSWTSKIRGVDPSKYIRPYMIDKNAKRPIYGDVTKIESQLSSEDKRESHKIVGKEAKTNNGDLSDEQPEVKNK